MTPGRPRIVCLSGSMRFADDIARAAADLSLAGDIVVMPHVNGKVRTLTDEEKAGLDRLHLAKIDLADTVMVVTRDGYIGDSTRAEIAYAEQTGKPVTVLDHQPGQVVLTVAADFSGPVRPPSGSVGARTPTPEGDATREPGREAHSPERGGA